MDQQLRTNPGGLDGVEVVWVGPTLDALTTHDHARSADVVVLDLDHLGDDPLSTIDALRQATRAELFIVSYHFARRDLLGLLRGEDTRVLQGPLTLSALRGQLLGLIVRDILSGTDKAPRQENVSSPNEMPLITNSRDDITTCPTCGARVPTYALQAPN
ncbi:MAG: hypothetical protein AAGD38_04485 [Acidobacteriota bacterium]